MLYILIILLAFMLYVGGTLNHSEKLYEFNLQETLPLRGFLAVSVMLTHLCPHLVEDAPLLKDFGLWGPPSVASFFLLTGYGLSISYYKKGNAYLHGFFKKRLCRLIWPLLIMTIVYQTYKYYVGNFEFYSMLLEPSPMTWFIYALVIWYVGFYLSFILGKSRSQKLLLIWLFSIVYIAITVYYRMAYYYISILPLPMAICYVYYEKHIKRLILKYQWTIWFVILFAILIIMGYCIAGQYSINLPGWGLPVNILVPWVLVYVTYYLGGWKNSITQFFGKISYEFYIVHGFVVMQLGDLQIGSLTSYGNALLVIVIVLFITSILAWLLNRICSRINAIFI